MDKLYSQPTTHHYAPPTPTYVPHLPSTHNSYNYSYSSYITFWHPLHPTHSTNYTNSNSRPPLILPSIYYPPFNPYRTYHLPYYLTKIIHIKLLSILTPIPKLNSLPIFYPYKIHKHSLYSILRWFINYF